MYREKDINGKRCKLRNEKEIRNREREKERSLKREEKGETCQLRDEKEI